MSQHDTLTLEPCPFCGGQPELEDCRTIWVVRCKCEACVLGKRAPEPDGSETDEYWQGIRQTAIDAWNRRAALSATQPAQAKQPEPAEHWHRLYREKCQQYNDRVAQLGGVIEGLEAEAAQGAGEVAAWQASDGGSSYISNEARSRNSAFRELYTIPLYTQPAAGADVQLLDAMERHRIAVVPEFEGAWDASVYGDEGEPQIIVSGDTPRDAIRAAIAASGRQE